MEISSYYTGQLKGYWVTLDGKEIHFSKDEFDRDLFIASLMMVQKKVEETKEQGREFTKLDMLKFAAFRNLQNDMNKSTEQFFDTWLSNYR